mgnify:CR=1 FL=1
MAKVKGDCSVACKKDKRVCWHDSCTIIKMLMTGKFLISNDQGFVRGATPAQLILSNEESRIYKEYDLEADQLALDAKAEKDILRWRLNHQSLNDRV